MRENWTTATIGDVVEVVGGSTPRTAIRSYWDGGIPWITPSEVTRQEGAVIAATDRTLSPEGLAAVGGRLLPAGTVLLTSRATVGAVALAGVPMAVNQGFAALVAGRQVDPTWLMFWCQAHRSDFEALAGGSTYPEVSKPKVREVPIDLPPLAQQRRIADLVSSLDSYAARLRQLTTAATTAYVSILCDTFERLGPQRAVPLGDLAETRLGKMLDAAKAGNGPALPYLRNADVQWDRVGLDDLKRTPLSERERHQLALKAGDVLICEGGEVGRTAVLDRDLPGVFFQKAVHRVRCGPRLRPRFLMHFMRYAAASGLLDDYSTSTTIAHLTGEKLRTIPIPSPAIAQQDRAVANLDALVTTARAAGDTAAGSADLRAALLDELLGGDHEIPASYDRFLDGAA